MAAFETEIEKFIRRLINLERRVGSMSTLPSGDGAVNALIGSTATYTISTLRAYGGAANGVVYVSDLGLFMYDAEDNTSPDNGTTVIVDSLGRRYKLTSLLEIFNSNDFA